MPLPQWARASNAESKGYYWIVKPANEYEKGMRARARIPFCFGALLELYA
jgi:hypothetical protein